MPILGRTFTADDGDDEPVVVSEGFWFRRLGGDPAAVGSTIVLDGVPHAIVGVVPRDFRFPFGEKDVFIATAFAPEVLANRGNFNWSLVAKLRTGVSVEAAQAELRAIGAAINAENPNTITETPAVVPLRVVGELVSIGTLFAFLLVSLGVWVLRRTRPDVPRPFRTPWVPLVPILSVLSCLALMAALPADTWIRLAVWLAVGLTIYFLYGRRHSVLAAREGERTAGRV